MNAGCNQCAPSKSMDKAQQNEVLREENKQLRERHGDREREIVRYKKQIEELQKRLSKISAAIEWRPAMPSDKEKTEEKHEKDTQYFFCKQCDITDTLKEGDIEVYGLPLCPSCYNEMEENK